MHELNVTQRREFLKRAGAAAALTGLAAASTSQLLADESSKPMKKSVKWGMIQTDGTVLEKFQLLKKLGFDGVELDAPSSLKQDEVLNARDKTGLPIHGVVDSVHWKETLSHPDAQVRAAGVKALEQAIRDSKHYGGSTVLLVPAVVNKEVSYAEAYERCQAEIRKVLPLAGELGIKIGLENVWNNFLLSPLETARFVDELESPQVGVYFDVGNVIRYGWPEHWIRTLGKRIIKLDIKEFSRKKQETEGLYKGFDVELLEGDNDWPAVMSALRDIQYEGWGTAEIPGGGEERLREIAARMDRIFAS